MVNEDEAEDGELRIVRSYFAQFGLEGCAKATEGSGRV